jgi:hypothetical protein
MFYGKAFVVKELQDESGVLAIASPPYSRRLHGLLRGPDAANMNRP